MKAQYRVFSEVVIFMVGVTMAFFIYHNYQSLEKTIKETAIEDQLKDVLEEVRSAIVKVIETKHESKITLKIPTELSNTKYKIVLNGNRIEVKTDYPFLNVSEELFNMDKNYTINGEVVSNLGYVIIKFDGNEVKITPRVG